MHGCVAPGETPDRADPPTGIHFKANHEIRAPMSQAIAIEAICRIPVLHLFAKSIAH